MKYTNEEKCFIYINVAKYNGKFVSKIGITKNIKKRISEFNNGLKFRARYDRKLNGVFFVEFLSVELCNRKEARRIEKLIHEKLKHKKIISFGNEVFSINGTHSKKILYEILSCGVFQ